MTVKVLENDGIYTAYRLIVTRRDDGTLRETVKHVDVPLPPPEGPWKEWTASLAEDQLEVGLQIFFDKWNFGRGSKSEYQIYKALHEERDERRLLGTADEDDIIRAIRAPRAANAGAGGTITMAPDSPVSVKVVGETKRKTRARKSDRRRS